MHIPAAIGVAALTLGMAATSAAAAPATPDLQRAAEQCFGKTSTTWASLAEACTKVVGARVSPDTKAVAHFNRGAAYERMGDEAKALADYNASLKIKPNLGRTLIARAGIYLKQEKLDLALADLNKAAAIDPKSSVAFNNRAVVHTRKNDHQKAIADFTKAIELDPKDALSYAARGSAYAMMNDNTRAMADLDKAISMDSKLVAAFMNRGTLRAAGGDKAGAKSDFEAVLAIAPNYPPAKSQLAALEKSGG